MCWVDLMMIEPTLKHYCASISHQSSGVIILEAELRVAVLAMDQTEVRALS